MFGITIRDEDPINAPINRVLLEMSENGPDTEEYPALISYLERLNIIKNQSKPERVKRDTMLTVAGNLLGILTIVAYEQKHIFRSAAASFLMKPKP